MPSLSSSLTALLLGLLTVLGTTGCSNGPDTPEYVARVGNQYLQPDELSSALENLPAGTDSTAARRQVIRQWTTQALLYREAQRRGLANDPDVQKRLQESRQSVLVNALLGRLYEEMPDEPSPEAVQTYFERHREALRFSVPHVRVRHLQTQNADTARAVLRRLREALPDSSAADSVWNVLSQRYAADTARAQRLATDFHAEPSLFSHLPAAAEHLAALDAGQWAPVFEAGGRHHVLQLIERVPAGTLPKLAWVEDEVRQRLVLQRRKQTYTRQVERLRNQARSSGELEGTQ